MYLCSSWSQFSGFSATPFQFQEKQTSFTMFAQNKWPKVSSKIRKGFFLYYSAMLLCIYLESELKKFLFVLILAIAQIIIIVRYLSLIFFRNRTWQNHEICYFKKNSFEDFSEILSINFFLKSDTNVLCVHLRWPKFQNPDKPNTYSTS